MVSIDTVANDEKLALRLVKSRLPQKKQRIADRGDTTNKFYKRLMSTTESADAEEKSSEDASFVRLVSGESLSSELALIWVIDSGATSYMCHDKCLFLELYEIAFLSNKISDDSYVHGKGNGVSCCKINVCGSVKRCKLKDVLDSIGLKHNLLSSLRMTKSWCKKSFKGST